MMLIMLILPRTNIATTTWDKLCTIAEKILIKIISSFENFTRISIIQKLKINPKNENWSEKILPLIMDIIITLSNCIVKVSTFDILYRQIKVTMFASPNLAYGMPKLNGIIVST